MKLKKRKNKKSKKFKPMKNEIFFESFYLVLLNKKKKMIYFKLKEVWC